MLKCRKPFCSRSIVVGVAGVFLDLDGVGVAHALADAVARFAALSRATARRTSATTSAASDTAAQLPPGRTVPPPSTVRPRATILLSPPLEATARDRRRPLARRRPRVLSRARYPASEPRLAEFAVVHRRVVSLRHGPPSSPPFSSPKIARNAAVSTVASSSIVRYRVRFVSRRIRWRSSFSFGGCRRPPPHSPPSRFHLAHTHLPRLTHHPPRRNPPRPASNTRVRVVVSRRERVPASRRNVFITIQSRPSRAHSVRIPLARVRRAYRVANGSKQIPRQRIVVAVVGRRARRAISRHNGRRRLERPFARSSPRARLESRRGENDARNDGPMRSSTCVSI